MKQKLIAWSKPLLYACMGWGLWVSGSYTSVLLLGEYPYPQKENN